MGKARLAGSLRRRGGGVSRSYAPRGRGKSLGMRVALSEPRTIHAVVVYPGGAVVARLPAFRILDSVACPESREKSPTRTHPQPCFDHWLGPCAESLSC